MSGGGDAPPAPNVYQSQFQPAADVGAISNIAGMQQYAGQGQDTYNAWAPAFASGAVPSGWSPTGTEASARNLVNSGTSLNDWGTRLLGMGFDPQNALYDRSAQQLTDQVRAGQAARGISMTPFGAGLEGKALGDFNIDWQNSAVDRASKAASGASPLFSQGASNILGGEQLSMAVPDLQQRLLTGLLSNQLGAQAIPQQIIKNYLDYLSGAAKGDANAVSRYSEQVKQAKNESDADSAMWGGIGKLAGNLVGAAGFF